MIRSCLADDVKDLASFIVEEVGLKDVVLKKVRFVRSSGLRSRCYARIFGVPNAIRIALNSDTAYVVEVNSHLYDPLSMHEKVKIVMHELTHISVNCNGSLRKHKHLRFRDKIFSKSKKLAKKYLKTCVSQNSTEPQTVFVTQQFSHSSTGAH
jgi:predicted metallopeptidase